MKHEFHCPVCGKENDTLQCESCGFDGSRDYERLLTLSRIPVDIKSIAGWKKHRENRLRCKGCGCSTFYVDLNTNRCVCSECGMEVEPEDGMFVRRQDSAAPKHQRSLAQGEASRYRSDIQYRRRVLAENWGLILGEALFYIFLLRNLILPYVIEGWMLIGRASPEYADSINYLIAQLADFCGAKPWRAEGEWHVLFGSLFMNRVPTSLAVGVKVIAISMLIGAISGVYLLARAVKALCCARKGTLTHPDCLKARIAILITGWGSFVIRSSLLPGSIYWNTSQSEMTFHYVSVGLVLLIPTLAIMVYRNKHGIGQKLHPDTLSTTENIQTRGIFTTDDLVNAIYDTRNKAEKFIQPVIYLGAFLFVLCLLYDHSTNHELIRRMAIPVLWAVPVVLYLTRKKENRWAVVLGILVGLIFYVNYMCANLGEVFSGGYCCRHCTNTSVLGMIGAVVINLSILRRMGWMDRDTAPAKSPAVRWWREHKQFVFYVLMVMIMLVVAINLARAEYGKACVRFVYTAAIQLVTPVLYEFAKQKEYRTNWRKAACVGVVIELAACFLALCRSFTAIGYTYITYQLPRLVLGMASDTNGVIYAAWFVSVMLKSLSIALGLKRMKAEHHDSPPAEKIKST